MYMPWIALVALCSFLCAGCITNDTPDLTYLSGQERCDAIKGQIHWSNEISTLNLISDLFRYGCYRETITIGTKAKERFRYKTYSALKETAEFFIPEGSVTDYVLESYERGYLTFLIAAAYLHMGQTSDVTVELNRFYHEETEWTYNYGQDPVNALIQAVMWENIPRDGFSARPFWLWLTRANVVDPKLAAFARSRLVDFDAKKSHAPWHVSELGNFPDLDWSMNFINATDGYFSVHPKTAFTSTCTNATEILIPTSTWFDKIAMRHAESYHPLVNAKSWIRLPFGAIYGLTTAVAGAGIAVGGCTADAGSKGNGQLCAISLRGGAAMIKKSADVVDFTLQPDLRHWQKIPAALLISTADSTKSHVCLPATSDHQLQRIL